MLARSYEEVTNQTGLDFFEYTKDEILKEFDGLDKGDLVVLVQSQTFRIDDYRIRLRLFEKGIKNVEHVHLGNLPEDQYPQYIESLSFNPFGIDGKLARKLKQIIEKSTKTTVYCDQTTLSYETPMEEVKLNLGDYEGMINIGGTFPVGEVFTEPKILNGVNGKLKIWGFPDLSRLVQVMDVPFEITITNGLLTDSSGAPDSFLQLLDVIREGEGDIAIREFGLGLNGELSKQKMLYDVTAFERQRGMHVSLGKKHTVYAKEGIAKRKSKFHIDLFVDVKEIVVDDFSIWKDNDYAVQEILSRE